MGFYSRLKLFIPPQQCILCRNSAKFCVCKECEASFTNSNNRCISCAKSLPDNLNLCGQCLAYPLFFNKTYTLFDYQDFIAYLIKKLKFNNALCVGDYFAYKIFDLYKSIIKNNGEYDAIIPMPLNSVRFKERGYNQSCELLRIIKKNTNTIIDNKSVVRIKNTKPFSSLSLKDRKNEIKNAFNADSIKYQRVLLFDDVMTTGSSLNELAKTVIKSGAKSCDVFTLSRA
jgi:ComF family protein